MALAFVDIDRLVTDRDGVVVPVAAAAVAEAKLYISQADRATFDATIEAARLAGTLKGYQVRNKLGKLALLVENNTAATIFLTIMCPSLVDGLQVTERKYDLAAGERKMIGPWTTVYHQTNTEDSVLTLGTPEHKDYLWCVFGIIDDGDPDYDVADAAKRILFNPIEIG
jgi:hypothetical protein